MPLRPTLYHLRTEYLENPLGIDELNPRFSWKIKDARFGALQRARQIQVASSLKLLLAGDANVWDSGWVESDASLWVDYTGPSVLPLTRYYWRVRITDHQGDSSQWSEAAWFETGFLAPDAVWPNANWIGLELPSEDQQPVRHLRKSFQLSSLPVVARLYITARGVFEPWLNGKRIGNDVLTPGWTDYGIRIEYLTYEITEYLQIGENVVGALIGDGWYAGYLSWNKAGKGHRYYGEEPALLATLHVVYPDGREEWIGTDSSWSGSVGPVRYADLYHGEYHDARAELGEWSGPAFQTRGWQSAKRLDLPPVSLNGKGIPPVREIEEIATVELTEPCKGHYIFDLGQNMVGVARLKIRAPRGCKVVLRFAEMLQEDGTLYTENLRSARCTDTYIASGKGEEIWQPRFTFHGFRYVEITGLPESPALDAITGIVLHTAFAPTGHFSTSNRLVNQLQSNIVWGQRGNFLEIPTDCPQRDERLGWTGDAQVFINTAVFNYELAGFFQKWMRDVVDAQHPDGAYADVAPDVLKFLYPTRPGGNAAWADAGVICPWQIYQHYGDRRILERNYPAMLRWIGYQEQTSTDFVRPDTSFGDWLAPDATRSNWGATPCDLIGTAYFAHTTKIVERTARLLGHSNDAERLHMLHIKVVDAFNRHYVTSQGRLAGDSQTAYLLALAFDLLPSALRGVATDHLVRALERRDHHLATGFVGTPLLCPILSRFGRHKLAYQLLLNEDYPSWLYPVVNGATTMWERWNSWTPDSGFGEAGMNSFNHYAYGAIGEWLYRTVAGIDFLQPGFRQILLKPEPGGDLREVHAELETPYGRLQSSWKREGRLFLWEISVPANTHARVIPPAAITEDLQINEVKWRDAPGVTVHEQNGEPIGFNVGAGNYLFEVPV